MFKRLFGWKDNKNNSKPVSALSSPGIAVATAPAPKASAASSSAGAAPAESVATSTSTTASEGTPPVRDREILIPRDKIAMRAYEIWVNNGRPAGTQYRDWLQAEAELRAEADSGISADPKKSR